MPIANNYQVADSTPVSRPSRSPIPAHTEKGAAESCRILRWTKFGGRSFRWTAAHSCPKPKASPKLRTA